MAYELESTKNTALALSTHTTLVLIYFASACMQACQGVLFSPRAKSELKVGENDSFDILFLNHSKHPQSNFS